MAVGIWLATRAFQPAFCRLPDQLIQFWGIVWVLPLELVVVLTTIAATRVPAEGGVHVLRLLCHMVGILSSLVLHSITVSIPIRSHLWLLLRQWRLLLSLSQLHQLLLQLRKFYLVASCGRLLADNLGVREPTHLLICLLFDVRFVLPGRFCL